MSVPRPPTAMISQEALAGFVERATYHIIMPKTASVCCASGGAWPARSRYARRPRRGGFGLGVDQRYGRVGEQPHPRPAVRAKFLKTAARLSGRVASRRARHCGTCGFNCGHHAAVAADRRREGVTVGREAHRSGIGRAFPRRIRHSRRG
jgi:hypothetical protein